jgi:hypothetical protein
MSANELEQGFAVIDISEDVVAQDPINLLTE